MRAGLGWLGVVLAASSSATETTPSGGPPGQASPAGEGLTLQLVTEVRPNDRTVRVVERLRKIADTESYFFKRVSAEKEHRFSKVVFRDHEGKTIPFREQNQRYMLEPFAGRMVEVEYEVELGQMGRHGHQGWIDQDWATFDGRIYLQPRDASSLAKVQVEYRLPEGWSSYTPWRWEDGRWHVEGMAAHLLGENLRTSCVALGRFTEERRTYGGTEVRLATYDGFGQEHQALLAERTWRTAAFFHDQLKWDLGFPFFLAFVPKAPDGETIFGGAWATGACYEQPEDRRRNWELLGHRFAHPMNKYNPSGLEIADPRDHWFMEGWASYIEVLAAAASGAAPEDLRGFDDLWRRYMRQREDHPGWDRPLAEEPWVHGEATEYLHYTKGPLVTKLLADELLRRSGKSLEAYMGEVAQRYGGHRAAWPLREDLQAWSGVDLSDFWALYVDGPGAVVPTWAAYERRGPSAEAPRPVARVGDLEVSTDLLYYLSASGRFHDAQAVEEYLTAAGQRRALLAARGKALWPQWVYDQMTRREAAFQVAVFDTELALPAHLLPPGGWGCGGDPAPVAFVLDDRHPDAALWSTLREADRRLQESRAAHGLHELGVRTHERDLPTAVRRAMRVDEPVLAQVVWTQPPDAFTYQLVEGRTPLMSRRMLVEPGWMRAWTLLDPKDRGGKPGLLSLQVVVDGQVVGERLIWQRDR